LLPLGLQVEPWAIVSSLQKISRSAYRSLLNQPQFL
jgi:hypothetical protein